MGDEEDENRRVNATSEKKNNSNISMLPKTNATLVVKFEKSKWINRKDVIDLVGQKIGKQNIASVFDEGEKKWNVTLYKQEHAITLLEEGISYQFQDVKYVTYPVIKRNDITNLEMSKTPFHVSNAEIFEILKQYGQAINIQTVYDEDNIATGVKLIQIVLKQHVPRRLYIPWHMGGGQLQIAYTSKPIIIGTYCYICRNTDHIANDCPKKVLCDFCGNTGRPHLTKNCRVKTSQMYEQEQRILKEIQEEKNKQSSKTNEDKNETPSNPDDEQDMDVPQNTENNTLPGQREMEAAESLIKLKNDSEVVEEPEESKYEEETENQTIPVLLIGDSQVKRIKNVTPSSVLQTAHVSGGGFNNGVEWMESKDPCVENLAIYFGTNHLKDEVELIKHHVDDIMKSSLKTAINTYIMGIVPYKIGTEEEIDVQYLNNIIKEFAEKYDAHFIEAPQIFYDNYETLYEEDGIHISEQGAKALVSKLLNEVKQNITSIKKRKNQSFSGTNQKILKSTVE